MATEAGAGTKCSNADLANIPLSRGLVQVLLMGRDMTDEEARACSYSDMVMQLNMLIEMFLVLVGLVTLTTLKANKSRFLRLLRQNSTTL